MEGSRYLLWSCPEWDRCCPAPRPDKEERGAVPCGSVDSAACLNWGRDPDGSPDGPRLRGHTPLAWCWSPLLMGDSGPVGGRVPSWLAASERCGRSWKTLRTQHAEPCGEGLRGLRHAGSPLVTNRVCDDGPVEKGTNSLL